VVIIPTLLRRPRVARRDRAPLLPLPTPTARVPDNVIGLLCVIDALSPQCINPEDSGTRSNRPGLLIVGASQ
jgi:hypothetical protein